MVESTISFYTLLFRRPVGKYMVQVCRNLSCIINGAEEIMAYARERLGIGHLETTADGLISYEEVECLAACDRAPCAQVNLEFVYDLTRESVDAMIAAIQVRHVRGGAAGADRQARPDLEGRAGHRPQVGRRLGRGDANNAGGIGDRSGVAMFDLIVGKPQYEARSQRAAGARDRLPPGNLGERTPLDVFARDPSSDPRHRRAEPARHRGLPRAGRLRAAPPRGDRDDARRRAALCNGSNLRGRGGAGFPTGRKWSFLPNNGRPRYLVCNCDEAEPGTFKDHMLLEQTPHQIIEGILIGAYAIGCEHAYIYIRGEFKAGYEIMREAVAQARAAGFLGDDAFGSGKRADAEAHHHAASRSAGTGCAERRGWSGSSVTGVTPLILALGPETSRKPPN